MKLRSLSPLAILACCASTAALAAVACATPHDTEPPVARVERPGGDAEAPADASGSDAAAADADPAVGRSHAGTLAILAPVFGRFATGSVEFVEEGRSPCTTVASAGGCTLTSCPLDDGGSVPDRSVYASAGDVTFSGGSPSVQIVVQPDPMTHAYAAPVFEYPGQAPFVGGEAALFHSAGAVIPAFDVAIQYPKLLLLDQPVAPTSGRAEIRIARGADLPLAWSRGAAGIDLLVEGGWTAAGLTSSLTCWAPSTDGSASLPAAILGRLPAGVTLTLYSVSRVRRTVAGYDVTALLGGEVLTPSRQAAVTLVTE